MNSINHFGSEIPWETRKHKQFPALGPGQPSVSSVAQAPVKPARVSVYLIRLLWECSQGLRVQRRAQPGTDTRNVHLPSVFLRQGSSVFIFYLVASVALPNACYCLFFFFWVDIYIIGMTETLRPISIFSQSAGQSACRLTELCLIIMYLAWATRKRWWGAHKPPPKAIQSIVTITMLMILYLHQQTALARRSQRIYS